MAELPQPGVYGNTGIDPVPQTPFSPEHPVVEQPPPTGNEPNPQTPIGEAIRRLLGR